MRFPERQKSVFLPRQNADKWITVHPNGADAKGRPALIDGEGIVKGGMGGKFNGKKIGEKPRSGDSQIGKKKTSDFDKKRINKINRKHYLDLTKDEAEYGLEYHQQQLKEAIENLPNSTSTDRDRLFSSGVGFISGSKRKSYDRSIEKSIDKAKKDVTLYGDRDNAEASVKRYSRILKYFDEMHHKHPEIEGVPGLNTLQEIGKHLGLDKK